MVRACAWVIVFLCQKVDLKGVGCETVYVLSVHVLCLGVRRVQDLEVNFLWSFGVIWL